MEGKGRKTGTNRLTGPDAGSGAQAMKAGSSRSHRVADNAEERAARVERKQLESSLGYGDRPNRPEPEQASVGLAETPAPFALEQRVLVG